MVQKILQAFEFVFGCWHFKLSRPFTLSGRTYEVCLDCGKQFAYARADLGQQFWPEKLDALGMQRGVSDENHASMGKRSAKPRLAGPTEQRLFRRRCAASRECGTARLVNMSCEERAVGEMNRDQRTNVRDFMGWRCGSCNRLITRVDNGWVEWLASEDDRGESSLGGLRLVHRGAPFAHGLEGSCQYNAREEFRNNRTIVEGLSLERLVGPDGLMVLLSLLAAGDLPKAQIIELTKRLHIPGYELSRNLSGATTQIALTAYLGESFYLQSELEELIARAIEQYAEPSSNFRSL